LCTVSKIQVGRRDEKRGGGKKAHRNRKEIKRIEELISSKEVKASKNVTRD